MKRISLFLYTIFSLLIGGCDPVRTTSQNVLLEVFNSNSGQPLSGVQVSLKYDYERNVPPAQRDPDEIEHSTYKWFSNVTDQHGQAGVDVQWTAIDRTIGPKPPSWRDWVTGKAYLIRLEKDQQHEESSLVIRTGASVHGDLFTVNVLEIQRPYYVKTGR